MGASLEIKLKNKTETSVLLSRYQIPFGNAVQSQIGIWEQENQYFINFCLWLNKTFDFYFPFGYLYLVLTQMSRPDFI